MSARQGIDMRLLAATDRQAFCAVRRDYQKRIRTFSKHLTPIPKNEWPNITASIVPDECWRSQEYLVQIFRPVGQPVRLSIVSVVLSADGSWQDGITWDQLQKIKSDVGFGDSWAVEVFPPNDEVVNVANIRHLWVIPAPEFAWRNKIQ